MCCQEHYLDYWNWLLDRVKPVNGEIITHSDSFHVTKKYAPESKKKIGDRFPALSYNEIYDIVSKSEYSIYCDLNKQWNTKSLTEVSEEFLKQPTDYSGLVWIKPKVKEN